MSRPELEVQAIIGWEEHTGKKFDLRNADQFGLDILVVNYLRHQYIDGYHQEAKRCAGTESYREVFHAAMSAIKKEYPYLNRAVNYVRARKEKNNYKPYGGERSDQENAEGEDRQGESRDESRSHYRESRKARTAAHKAI